MLATDVFLITFGSVTPSPVGGLGAEVVNWTETTDASMSRTELNLLAGQTYYIAVKARNAGGLWSEAAIPPGVLAGSGLCAANEWRVFMPILE